MKFRIFGFVAAALFLILSVVSFVPLASAYNPSDLIGLNASEASELLQIDVSSPWCVRFARAYCLDLGLSCPSSDSTTTCYQDLVFHHQISDFPSVNNWIFFDWELDGILDHVGVVLSIQNNQVISIEGNVSDSIVSRSWNLDDPRIFAYGLMSSSTKQLPHVQSVVGPVTPSNTNGLKKALIELIGDYDPIVEEYAYTNQQGYISYVREITPDYPWLIGAGIVAIFIYCLFRLGGSIICKR